MSSPRDSDRRPDNPPLHVLAIDDDPAYRLFVEAVAQRQGWMVTTAENGEAALELLQRQRFDLLLVDYQMPRLDGIGLIARIRGNDALRNTYAIMLTGRGDTETRVAALTAGFDDFMVKDASETEIAAKLLATSRVLARQQDLDVTVRRLYGLATRDELTGMLNRRFFLEETHRLLERGLPVILVLFDLDDFKAVNDTYGHLAGDRVLRDVGAAFHAATRAEDLIARYGGDEFVLTVTRLPLEAVARLTVRLTDAVARLSWSTDSTTFAITATTGIASSVLLPSPDVEQLLNVADRDLYKNKWLRKHPDETPASFEAMASRPDFVFGRRVG